MVGTMVCLAAMTLGVDVGWAPSDGGLEYIIQIKPEQLDSLRAGGLVIRSDVRPQHRGELRTYRIQVGAGPLPKTDLPEPPALPPKEPAAPAAPPSETQAKKEPATLPDAENPKHIVEQADYREPSPSEKEKLAGMTPNLGGASDDRTEKYLVPMVIVSGTAIGLLAALVYLSWIHVGTRNRYRALLAEHMALAPPTGQDPLGRTWPA
jgi:hypothetical protein